MGLRYFIHNNRVSMLNLVFAMQRAGAAEIEIEQTLVTRYSQLITHLGKKIQLTLARIRGQDKSTPAEP
jgi:hypothetical protein